MSQTQKQRDEIKMREGIERIELTNLIMDCGKKKSEGVKLFQFDPHFMMPELKPESETK